MGLYYRYFLEWYHCLYFIFILLFVTLTIIMIVILIMANFLLLIFIYFNYQNMMLPLPFLCRNFFHYCIYLEDSFLDCFHRKLLSSTGLEHTHI